MTSDAGVSVIRFWDNTSIKLKGFSSGVFIERILASAVLRSSIISQRESILSSYLISEMSLVILLSYFTEIAVVFS